MKTKNLIKIHYPYPSDEVKVVENYSGKSAKELFEAAKDKDGLVSVDGFVSSVDVSKDYIEPDRIEVKLHNVTDIARKGEFSKLTYKEIQLVLREIPITDKEYEENKERFHGIGLDEIRKFEKRC